MQPEERCAFSSAPAEDPFPGHVDVHGTPSVIDFDPATPGVSIVALFAEIVPNNYFEDRGIVRVLRGTDCTLEANLGGTDVDEDDVVDWLVSSTAPALADLDGDGVAEIVANGADGSTLAFTRRSGVWQILWKAPLPAGAPWSACNSVNHRCGWGGPTVADVNGDGKPEVLREGVVFAGVNGALLSAQPATYVSLAPGLFPHVGDLDRQPGVELTNGRNVWTWVGAGWSPSETYATRPAVSAPPAPTSAPMGPASTPAFTSSCSSATARCPS